MSHPSLSDEVRLPVLDYTQAFDSGNDFVKGDDAVFEIELTRVIAEKCPSAPPLPSR